MRKTLCMLTVLVLSWAFVSQHAAQAQSEPGYYSSSDAAEDDLLTPEELDDLLAPIALYPDPLIAQILPAATFVDQIDEAARFVRMFGATQRIDDQPWDLSVKAVAHYPDVLYMMDQRYEWTVALGQAFLEQPEDVMDSIQALRAEALERGNLVSTREQQVIVEAGDIRIVPALPEYIYVPVYDPQVIYVETRPSYGFITFSAGFAIGAWLSRDLDWRRHRVYYHGWRGPGWVTRSRPHIHDRRSIYINKRAATITTNRRVLQHNTVRFRSELRNDVIRRRELPGRPAPAPRATQPRPGRVEEHRRVEPGRVEQGRPRPDQGRPGGGRDRSPEAGRDHRPASPPAGAPAAPASAAPATPGTPAAPAAGTPGRPGRPGAPAGTPQHAPAAAPPAPAPAGQPAPGASGAGRGNRDVFRGRDVQGTQPASRSGYGGYGSSKDASTYRERGQSSRENMRQPGRPAQTPAQAPKPAAPAAAPAPAPKPAAVAPAPRPEAPRPHIPRPVMPPPAAGQPAARPAAPAARPAAPAVPAARPAPAAPAPRPATPAPEGRERGERR